MPEKNDSRMDRRDYFKSSLQSNRVSFRKRYKKMNRKSLFEFFVNQHLYFFLLLSVMQSPLFYLVVVFPARISFIFKLFTSSLLPIADMSKCHSPIGNSLLVVTEELQNKYFMNLLVFFVRSFTAWLDRWIWRRWFDPSAVWSSHVSPITRKFR